MPRDILSPAGVQDAFCAGLLGGAEPPPGITAPVPSEAALRFKVYRNNVQHGLSRALAAQFPVVAQLVGPEFFAAMARAFIATAPPRDPVLLYWGAALPAFVARFAPVAHLPYLADVARLEYVRARASHAADAVPINPDALHVCAPQDLRLVLHPSVSLFCAHTPAVQIWLSHQPGRARAPLVAGPDHALIARRPDFGVAVEPLDQGSHDVMSALCSGETLGQAACRADPTAALTLLLRHGAIIHAETGATA